MTYEQAVATALLGARLSPKLLTLRFGFSETLGERLDEALYALRRLRVRAGLVP